MAKKPRAPKRPQPHTRGRCIRGIGTDAWCAAKARRGLVCGAHHARLRELFFAAMKARPRQRRRIALGGASMIVEDDACLAAVADELQRIVDAQ